MKIKKVLFLYSELAEYFLSCIKFLVEICDATNINIEIHIVKYPVNIEAPFRFSAIDRTLFYNTNDYTSEQLLNLAKSIQPDLIVCSGWVNKAYLAIAKSFYNKIPTVITFDNQWTASIKQRVGSFISPFFLLRRFSHAWVPGKQQQLYASKLGFNKQNILSGFYSTNLDYFNQQYIKNKSSKIQNFPKKIIFVGRYIKSKGIFDLWKAFIQLQTEQPNDWELWCLGTGELFDQKIEHEKIKHFGFVQPQNMTEYIRQTGVFILPSMFEPWGVVIQEFAASGFPIICSNKIGAAQQFVVNQKNGFIFEAGNVNAIKETMKKIIKLNPEKLLEMGEQSVELSKSVTPDMWVDSILNLI